MENQDEHHLQEVQRQINEVKVMNSKSFSQKLQSISTGN